MARFFKSFFQDQNGSATVEFVILAAAVVGLAVSTVAAVEGGAEEAASSIGTSVEAQVQP